MPKAKKKEIVLIDCPHCDSFDAETWDLVETHVSLVHATVSEKVSRGDYTPKVAYPPYSDKGDAARAERDAYRTEQGRLTQLFKHDLEVENGVENNAKKEKVFDLAWSHGHSSGFYEVANYYNQFVDLIK